MSENSLLNLIGQTIYLQDEVSGTGQAVLIKGIVETNDSPPLYTFVVKFLKPHPGPTQTPKPYRRNEYQPRQSKYRL